MLRGKQFQNVVAGGPLLIDFVVTLSEGQDGAIWAGTYGKDLWRVKGDQRIQYTTADGLSSDQIRSLYQDAQGTLWIGTFGGGLNALRDGKFFHYGATGRTVERQHRQGLRRWRIAVAEHYPRHLPDRQERALGL